MSDLKQPLVYTPEIRAAYKATLEEVAGQWANNPPDYASKAGSLALYATMRDTVINRMIVADPVIEKVAKSVSNAGGMGVISRFFYTGAAMAAQQGMSAPEVSSALYQPASFRELIPLMREQYRSARDIERGLGLKEATAPNLNEFTLSSDGLKIKKYAIHRYLARSHQYDKGYLTEEEAFSLTPEDDPIRCIALTSGLVTYAYKYMLDICVKDPSLFPATVLGENSTAEDSAASHSACARKIP